MNVSFCYLWLLLEMDERWRWGGRQKKWWRLTSKGNIEVENHKTFYCHFCLLVPNSSPPVPEREGVEHRVKATATATRWYSVTVFLPLTIMNGFIHYLPHPWPRPSVVMRLIPRGAEGGCHHFKCFWCLAYSVSSSSPSFLLCYMLQCIVRVPPSSGCCLFRFLWCLFLLQAIY